MFITDWRVGLIQGLRLSLGGGRSEVVFVWWIEDFLFLGPYIGVLGNADPIFGTKRFLP
jgi:hypothetical protein